MALETFETTGGLQHDHLAASALRGEYASLTGQDKQLLGEVARLSDGIDRVGAQVEKNTPVEKAGKAFEKFAQTRQLTPEMKKQFEDAIAEADKGPSAKTAGLEKQVGDLKQQLDKVFPKSAQDEVEKLDKEAQEAFQKLPEDKQEKVAVLMQLREFLPADDRSKIDDQLKQVAPDILDKVQRVEKLTAPAVPILGQLQEAATSLEMEKHQDSMTRLLYGVV